MFPRLPLTSYKSRRPGTPKHMKCRRKTDGGSQRSSVEDGGNKIPKGETQRFPRVEGEWAVSPSTPA